MKVGFTYDLKSEYLGKGLSEEEAAEFDGDDTISAIEAALQRLGHDVLKIGNIYNLTEQLAKENRWDIVFNISEGAYGPARQSQVPALLEAYRIPYTFSDPLSLAVCLDKAMTKNLVLKAGVRTPGFSIISSLSDMKNGRYENEDIFPLFIKPVSEGTGKGVSAESIIWDIDELRNRCRILLERFKQPVLAEAYLTGREFTAGILGTGRKAECVGVMQILLNNGAEPGAYSYLNREMHEKRVTYRLIKDRGLIKEAEEIALKAYRLLGCRDAGRVDLKADEEGRLHFLEINPLAGLHPERSDLTILCAMAGITYDEMISRIIDSAQQRIRTTVNCARI